MPQQPRKKPERRPARATHLLKAAEFLLKAAQPTGTAMPKPRGQPQPVYPIAVTEEQRALAPAPLIDRYPIVVGQGLNFSYLASCMRLATTGYPQQYYDLLNELLEHDPHLQSVLSKRIMATATGRLELTAPKLPVGHKDYDAAQDILEFCRTEVSKIPDLVQTIAGWLWALYYGLAASEMFWNRTTDGWHLDRFGFIHRRRLAYPQYQSWDLHVWDQGQVFGWKSAWGNETNSHIFGLRIADWPGKFLVHAPQVRGDYPTREGLGRGASPMSIAKRIGMRACMEYLERFFKGFFDVEYATQNDGVPREATDQDIAVASQIASMLGPGSGSLAAHADSIKINPKSFDSGTPKLRPDEFVSLCNAEQSKLVVGGTLGTDAGKGSGGNRALGEVQERAELDLETYDALCVAQSFKRDFLSVLVRLNFPDDVHLTPNAQIHVEADPAPKELCEVAKEMNDLGAPVDVDALSERTGIQLVPNDETNDEGDIVPRRSMRVDVATAIRSATALDIPVDVAKAGKMIGVPVINPEDLDKTPRTRLVATSMHANIEPNTDDPNDPNSKPTTDDAQGADAAANGKANGKANGHAEPPPKTPAKNEPQEEAP